MFGFSKKKNEAQSQAIQPLIPQEVQRSEFIGDDILNPKEDTLQPAHTELPSELILNKQDLDFDTIEIKTRPNTKSAYQLATFSDLSLLAKKTPIFVFRDKRMNTYFGVVEGKVFYLKK